MKGIRIRRAIHRERERVREGEVVGTRESLNYDLGALRTIGPIKQAFKTGLIATRYARERKRAIKRETSVKDLSYVYLSFSFSFLLLFVSPLSLSPSLSSFCKSG